MMFYLCFDYFRAYKHIVNCRNITVFGNSIEYPSHQSLNHLKYMKRCFGTTKDGPTDYERSQSLPTTQIFHDNIGEQTGMTLNDWMKRWENKSKIIRWQLIDVHPFLKKYAPSSTTHKRVLVPLTGKTIDVIWLVERGFEVNFLK